MNKNELLQQADNILNWLNTSSDDVLFEALSNCDSTIHYAINHNQTLAYFYSFKKFYFDRALFSKLEIANEISTTISNAVNDDYYSLAA
jgi:hypothetical protein